MAAATFVYVSNSQDGEIGCHRLEGDGALTPIGRVSAAAGLGPMTVRHDRRVLIAASRSAPYMFHSYAIDQASGALSLVGRTPAHESVPYIFLDKTGRWLLAASYSANLVTVNAVGADGVVEAPPLQVIPIGRNAHAIRLDQTNRYAWVPTLGSDQIFQFAFDPASGRLSSNTPAIAMVKAGTGPRHLMTSPDNRFLYVLNEMHGTVTRFVIDSATGLLSEQESVLALAPDTMLVPGAARGPTVGASVSGAPRDTSNDIWAADLHLTPDGHFLYASERTSSTIAAFAVDRADGRLTWLANTPTEKQPRGFAIDPSGRWLIAAGEKSDKLSVYAIDAARGSLRLIGRHPGGLGASWIEIVSA